MILDPFTVSPNAPITDALELMKTFRISGVPVTVKGKRRRVGNSVGFTKQRKKAIVKLRLGDTIDIGY